MADHSPLTLLFVGQAFQPAIYSTFGPAGWKACPTGERVLRPPRPPVIPAQAGIQKWPVGAINRWVPASAGTTGYRPTAYPLNAPNVKNRNSAFATIPKAKPCQMGECFDLSNGITCL